MNTDVISMSFNWDYISVNCFIIADLRQLPLFFGGLMQAMDSANPLALLLLWVGGGGGGGGR